jgi:hypothetical protein
MNKPKITIKPASDEIIAAANTIETIAVGQMTIGLKRPGILSQYRIVEVVGESAKNEVYMGMINPILWVHEVNGEHQPAPSTKRELEALIQLLGEEGVVAIADHITLHLPSKEGVESVKN